MPKPKSKYAIAVAEAEREQQRLMWRCRVRRMAIERKRWIKVATSGLPQAEREATLHRIEIRQRQVKVDLWRSIPDCTGWVGTGKNRTPQHKDTDRYRALGRFEDDVKQLMGQGLDPDPPHVYDPAEGVVRHGPFDIELDEIDKFLGQPASLTIAELGRRKERMDQKRTYKPGVGYVGGPAPAPQAVKPAGPTPGRPTVPEALPMDIEKALAYTLPFGKFQGQTLEWMLGDDESMGYMHWLCNKAEIKSPKFREALDVFLVHYEGEMAEANRRR